MVLETDGEGNVTNKYIRGINLIYSGEGVNRRYFLYNGHGDTVQLTSTTGSSIKTYDYDAFGNEKNADPNDTNLFRYCGEYFDKETGTIYLRARYYDPTIGRFITEDSVWGKDNDPLSLNLYTYCHNDPVNFFDPSGHKDVVTTYTGTYRQSNGDVCINVDTNTVVWGTRGNVAIENYRIITYGGTTYLVGNSYTETEYTLTKHTFTNLNISVYETSNGKGFSCFAEDAYLNNSLGFIESGETTKISTAKGLASLDTAHKGDKTWAWIKVGVSGISDVVPIVKAAKAGKVAKAGSGIKTFFTQFFKEQLSIPYDDIATSAVDATVFQEDPDYKWLTGLIPIYGTYQAIVDAKSNEPLGAFVPMN